ncbi:MAG TPA: geranylgeranyl reductase family protein [Ilumatobacter sp.]|nr:geranylgeranyl reductase family protein [Ilumatobacter sp.]
MYDVLIVGAGPAGSAAAIELATAGHQVVVVERDRLPRPKPCGELLTPRCLELVDALGLDADTLGHRLDHVRLTFDEAGERPRRRSTSVPWPSGTHARVAPREQFDGALAARAVALGVELRDGHTAVEPIVERGFVRGARVTGPDDSAHDVRATYTLVADGARSRFGRALGTFREPSWPHALAHRARYRSAIHDASEAELVLGLRDRGTPVTGYASMFPRGDGTVNVGVMVLSSSPSFQVINPARLLDEVVAEHADGWRLDGPPVDAPAGGRLPLGASVGPQAGPTYLVAGDAAGMANPLGGTGIEYALATGRAAAEVLGEAITTGSATALQRYPRLLDDTHGTYFQVGRLAVRLFGNPQLSTRVGRLAASRHTTAEAFLRLATNQLRPGWGLAETMYRTGRALTKIAPSA